MITLKTLNLKEDPIEYISKKVYSVGYKPSDIAVVFPTARGIRYFYRAISCHNPLETIHAPYCYDISEFLKLCLNANGTALIDDALRIFYLHKAIGSIDGHRLSELFKEGYERFAGDYLSFISTGQRLLRFYDEIATERVSFQTLKTSTLYTDYEKHIALLEQILTQYKGLLSGDGLTDPIFLKMDARINLELLEGFKKIYFLTGGYLSNFELELIKAISDVKDIELILRFEGQPDGQTRKIYSFFDLKPENTTEETLPSTLEIHEFEEATSQFGFILSSVERSLNMGIPSEEIVVVLPDENFKRIMFSLDRERIFNFAMGLDMKETLFYSFLKGIERLFHADAPDSFRTLSLIPFIEHPFVKNLLPAGYADSLSGQPKKSKDKAFSTQLIEDIKEKNRLLIARPELFRSPKLRDFLNKIEYLLTSKIDYNSFLLRTSDLLRHVLAHLDKEFIDRLEKSPEFKESRKVIFEYLFEHASKPYYNINTGNNAFNHLKYLNQQISGVNYPDVAGGAITVMGVLETRDLRFKAVIIPDMNEEIIPKRSEKELFLNTAIRKSIGIPTYTDRENLGRYYFLSLIKNADAVYLSYVKTDNRRPRSRFIEEILTDTGIEHRKGLRQYIFSNDTADTPYSLTFPDMIKKDAYTMRLINRMPLSPTSIKTYLECRYRFLLKYIKAFKEPVEVKEELRPFDLGNIFHEAIKKVYRKNKSFRDHAALYEVIVNAVRKEAVENYDIFRLSHHARFELDVFVEKLRAFVDKEIERFSGGWHPEYIEKTLSVPIFGHEFKGMIDRVDIRQGKAMIIDYKLSDVRPWKKVKFDTDFTDVQLPLYMAMFQKAVPEIEVEGIAYYDMKRTFSLITAFEKMDIADFMEFMQGVIAEMKDRAVCFSKTENIKVCRHCGFIDMCRRN